MCICVDTDYVEDTTILKTKIVTSRKSYQCGECRCGISPGQKYEYVAGKCDGIFFVHRTCVPCAEVRDRLLTCGYIFEAVWDDINNALELIGIGDLDGLSLEAIGKFEEMTREECWHCGEKIDEPGKYLPWGEGPLCDKCFKSFEDKKDGE
jgi:hypothetical protein